MNVTELSSNLYRRAGIRSTDILSLRSTRRTDRPSSDVTHGAGGPDGPRFSEVLAALTEKHRPQPLTTASPAETGAVDTGLSRSEARALLQDALQGDTLPDELVNALTDNSGDISDTLLDLIFADDEEDTVSAFADSPAESPASILTDARLAQSYLTTQSGRDLMVALAQNSISSIIANTT